MNDIQTKLQQTKADPPQQQPPSPTSPQPTKSSSSTTHLIICATSYSYLLHFYNNFNLNNIFHRFT